MCSWLSQLGRRAAAVVLTAALGLPISAARAEVLEATGGAGCATWVPYRPAPCPPAPCPTAPQPATPIAPTTPQVPVPTQPPPVTPPSAEVAFAPEQAAAGGGESVALAESAVGYIDSAIISNMFRLRFDSAYGANRPDRAEFFYPKCGCFRILGLDPNAKGPPPGDFNSKVNGIADFHVDYQELSAYGEVALTPNISVFIEAPVRFVNFSVFPEENGFSDLNFGFKAALLNDAEKVLTFQFRTYTVTGEGDRGLGTEHWSVEPALLSWNRLGQRLFLESELRLWIPIDGSDFAGEVVRYGAGLSYVACDTGHFRVVPVVELVGWTALNGKELAPDGVHEAGGDTIINAKFGARFGLGSASYGGYLSHSDLYVGYGRALTGEVWYKDIVRVELRMAF